MPQPKSKQLKLSTDERNTLARLIEQDWIDDSRDMSARQKAYKRWYDLWRAAVKDSDFPDQDKSNFHIPLTQWQVLAKLSKEIDALLGDDAEVAVRGIGPSDASMAPKIARYMNWRMKISLKIFKKFYDYLLQKIILGTTIGYVPWVLKTRTVRENKVVEETQKQTITDPTTNLPMTQDIPVVTVQEIEKDVVDFEGPDLVVENIEDWAFPANAKGLDCDHFERRLKLSVDELLDMAETDKLDRTLFTDEFVSKLRSLAETGKYQDAGDLEGGKQVRDEKAAQSGLPTEEMAESRNEKITVINWFGKYRPKNAKPKDRAGEVVAYWQPDSKTLLGASRLVDMFPDGRRPFVKSELIRDVNSIFGIGLPELLESINLEMDTQHNALTDAGVYAIGPVIFYEPASGFNPEKFTYEPFKAYPCANTDKVKVINLANINMGPTVALQPQLLGFAERVSGLTEAELGRPFSQANAPRTLGQQQILSSGSGVRLLLDLRNERESLRELINRIWDLDKRFAPKPIFFRVSESQELEQLTEDEMEGQFDFDIGPLTGSANKAEEVQRLLQGYALALQNPVAARNPVMLAEYLKKINTKLGLDDLNQFIPDLSNMEPPKSPEMENAMLVENREVHVNPMDNHIQHIAKHSDLKNRLQMAAHPLAGSNAAFADRTWADSMPGIMGHIDAHIAEHEQAMKSGSPMLQAPSQNQAGAPSLAGAGQNGNMATDPSGQAASAMNQLKSMLNANGLNQA